MLLNIIIDHKLEINRKYWLKIKEFNSLAFMDHSEECVNLPFYVIFLLRKVISFL